MKIAKALGAGVEYWMGQAGWQEPVLYIQRTRTKPQSRPPYI